MPQIKAIFFYQDEWEAERFRHGAPSSVEVVTLPRGTPPEEADGASRDAHMIIGGGRIRELDVARGYPNLKLVQTLSAGTNYLPVAELAEMLLYAEDALTAELEASCRTSSPGFGA